MTFARTLAVVALCTLPLSAAAQWMWVDKQGRKVFSDKAPPPETLQKDILRRPGMRSAMSPADAAAAAPGQPASAAAAKPQTRDSKLEERKKQLEKAEADKDSALDAQAAAVKEDNCRRARQSKSGFDNGLKITRVNEKGEREALDDQQRAAEVKRLENVIKTQCQQG